MVDSAGDGMEAEYYGLEYPYDVAVIDLGLPRRDGLEIVLKGGQMGAPSFFGSVRAGRLLET